MVQARDPLELLLPDASEATLHRGRSVVQFLRLLANDAVSTRAAVVGLGLDEARCQLEAHDRAGMESALCDLLRHHLRVLSTPGSFLAWGEAGLPHDAAWRVLDELREVEPRIPPLPEPGEQAVETAKRLLACLRETSSDPTTVALWEARLIACTQGPREAEAIARAQLDAVFRKEEGSGRRPASQRALVACVAESLLDRGAVREARDWLIREAGADSDPRLRQLLGWSLIALGNYSAAKAAVVGQAPGPGTLPLGLVDLRAHRPEWLPCLSGRAAAARPRAVVVPVSAPPRDRSHVGACVLGVFALRPDSAVVPVHLDVAPGLRGGVSDWLEARDGAAASAGEREHRLVVTARPVVEHADGVRPLHGVLGTKTTLAVACTPILDGEGEVAGWLHVECEHHLLPDPDRSAVLAEAWREEVLLARHEEDRSSPGGGAPRPTSSAYGMLEDPEAAAPAEVFRELIAELAIKTAQRRWWGFVHGEGETLLAGSGGEVSALAMRPEGRGRALRRAIATRTPVTFDEPEPGLALDERSASGIVLPVVVAGELCGALVVESVRRRDFGEVEWSRHAETAQRAGLALRLASFRGWHRERYGHDVWFDARRRDFRDFALHLLAAARSRSPVVLCGPTGAGKAVLSRWIHFEGRGRERRLHAVECGSANLRGAFEEWAAAADGGTLVLEDVDRLALERQGEFLRRLEHRASDSSIAMPRLIATARCDLGEAVEDGRLRGDLAHRLDRLQFRVPPLAERREDIPPLVECLTRRFADEEGLRPRAYEDDVIAFLWRQTWEGNLRELESFVYKLVLLARVDGASQQRSIDAALVQSLAGRFATRLVCRIPSRHPRARDIVAALRVTRMPNGRTNKTRAAAYLGWDPDTLVARMKDCGLPDEVPEEEAWGASRGPEEGSTAG